MNNLTEKEIKYLRDCVLSSTLLGHEVNMGSKVLRKLDEELSGTVEQLKCKDCKKPLSKDMKHRCYECYNEIYLP